MSTGPEMLLASVLKVFISKEDADKIAAGLKEAANNGTFEKIFRFALSVDSVTKELADLRAEIRRLGRIIEASDHSDVESRSDAGSDLSREETRPLLHGPGSNGADLSA